MAGMSVAPPLIIASEQQTLKADPMLHVTVPSVKSNPSYRQDSRGRLSRTSCCCGNLAVAVAAAVAVELPPGNLIPRGMLTMLGVD